MSWPFRLVNYSITRPINYVRRATSDLVPVDELWCVSGYEINEHNRVCGSGVIEWCYSRQDAREVMERLKRMNMYTLRGLRIHKWDQTEQNPNFKPEQDSLDQEDIPTEEVYK